MVQFQPIRLCNFSYKIISKVLCQRLKKVPPDRISKTQPAFIARRQIMDNIMIAHEMFHVLRTKPRGRNKRMAIKTYMNNAYDMMIWTFIRLVMQKMRFFYISSGTLICKLRIMSFDFKIIFRIFAFIFVHLLITCCWLCKNKRWTHEKALPSYLKILIVQISSPQENFFIYFLGTDLWCIFRCISD